ncbi:hypothetical protein NOVO_00355 [Rickettsiales bacterium Ac37b]|nr:hypothetical protein NOVO_00355 [Rickettsiales bacterium Ac37b]
MKLSDQIIEEARSWLGTKFHHQGRLKKSKDNCGGCDCIGLIIGIAAKFKLLSKQSDNLLLKDCDNTSYPKIPNGTSLYTKLSLHLQEIEINQLQYADILLFNFNDNPQHVALVSNYITYNNDQIFSIIHAYIKARKVVEHRLDTIWKKRITAVFRFRELY